jgi:glycosyltransferase involved in cell wall biosynthesis
MKILVYAHVFEMGGTQVNAIELSAALRDIHGHEVVLYASPGPMVALAEAKGLRFIAAPPRYQVSNLTMMRALDRVLRDERPDVVQAWEKAQSLEAFYVAAMLRRLPVIAIDMRSDMIRRILPKTPITTFGTPEFVDLARAVGRRNAALLLPPVDVGANAPGAVDGAGFRTHYAIPEDGFTIVSVSRLTSDMEKDDTLDRLIGAVEILGHSLPLRLVIVGDGDARSKLERRAAAANSRLGRLAVTLTGEILDPRPAYQAADIVAGMGGSTLRGMAFGKPTIVMGSKGFAEILGPDTASRFYYKGLYGIGNEDTGSENLVRVLRDLFRRPDSLLELGAFARSFVVRHFSLEAVAACLETYCRDAAEKRPSYGNLVVDALRTSAVCSAHIVRQRINGLPI